MQCQRMYRARFLTVFVNQLTAARLQNNKRDMDHFHVVSSGAGGWNESFKAALQMDRKKKPQFSLKPIVPNRQSHEQTCWYAAE